MGTSHGHSSPQNGEGIRTDCLFFFGKQNSVPNTDNPTGCIGDI